MEHNENAQWIKDQEQELKELIQIEWEELTVEKLKSNVTRAANWKSPGSDKVPNFWIKQFISLQQAISSAFSEVLQNPEQAPEWLVEGSTILLQKKVETWIHKNYRPITCLPTTFKNLTSIITVRLYNHLEKQDIMAIEQRVARRIDMDARTC